MPQIILASKSPRRQELLKHIVPEFEIRTKETEEVYPNNMAAKDVPVYLAQLKAKAFIASMKDDELIITSDTVVAMKGVLYGKPRDREEAIHILEQISGNSQCLPAERK